MKLGNWVSFMVLGVALLCAGVPSVVASEVAEVTAIALAEEKAAEAEEEHKTLELSVYQAPGDHLAVAQLVLSDLQLSPPPLGREDPLLAAAFLHENDTIEPLYLSQRIRYTGQGQASVELFFCLPKQLLKSLQSSEVTLEMEVRLLNEPDWKRKTADYALAMPPIAIRLVDDPSILESWRERFVDDLLITIARHEDHEMELLLLRRFAGTFVQSSADTWKRDDLLRVLFGIMGVNDIQDALPQDDTDLQLSQVYDQKSPEPLLLPAVPAELLVDFSASPMARWVPRSCAYVEWTDWARMQHNVQILGQFFDEWSPGSYPRDSEELFAHFMQKFGLDKGVQKVIATAPLQGIALAAWDPYLQGGTNLLLVITSQEANALDLSAVPRAVKADKKTWLLTSGGERLEKMALKAFDHGKALWQDPHFQQARQRFQAAENETEHGFLFLSDYWFTNFLSPRWYILSQRRRSIDARLRFTALLQQIVEVEHGLDELPDLAQLKELSPLSEADSTWLFHDFIEQNGKIQHAVHGGIYAHTPIDELSFEGVSSEEALNYENFKRVYSRRWRQADPIALQVLTVDNDLRLRLLQSPISNNSFFRELIQFVPKQKQSHRIPDVEGLTAGLSLNLETESITSMLGQRLPILVNLQAAFFDTAPKSYQPKTWLDPKPAEDWISLMRIPGAALIPKGVFNQLSPLLGMDLEETGFEHISYLDTRGSWFVPMLLQHPGEALVALGTDPSSLVRLRDNFSGWKDVEITSDIYAWIDGREGYQMRRKLLQLAVKNRSLAAWRRSSRQWRAQRLLGGDRDEPMVGLPYFPIAASPAAIPFSDMPPMAGQEAKSYRGSSVDGHFDDLPWAMLEAEVASFAVSVEPDTLIFETRLSFVDYSDEELGEANGAQIPAEQTTLDFEE